MYSSETVHPFIYTAYALCTIAHKCSHRIPNPLRAFRSQKQERYTLHIQPVLTTHRWPTNRPQSPYPSCAAYTHPTQFMHRKNMSIYTLIHHLCCMTAQNIVIVNTVQSLYMASRSSQTISLAHSSSHSHIADPLLQQSPKQISLIQLLYPLHTQQKPNHTGPTPIVYTHRV